MRAFPVCVVLLALLGCGQPSHPLPPDPPRVSLVAPGADVADSKLDLTLSLSGCDSVKALEIWDHQYFAATVTYGGNPTHVSLPYNVFHYPSIAVDLSLTAKVICADGRTSTSNPVSVRYFPVAEVVTPQAGGQVVPDVFIAEGQGPNVGFTGCSRNADGTTSLVRVGRTGTVTAYNSSLPFACSNNLWFTDRNLASGKRWAVEPGVGAIAVDPLLTITAYVLGPVQYLGVGPDGDAVIYLGGNGTELIERVSQTDGKVKWSYQPDGVVIAPPIAQSTFGVYAPIFVRPAAQTQGVIAVQRIDYDSGLPVARRDLRMITWGLGDAPPVPPAVFNNDGSLLYFAFQPQADTSVMIACATNEDGCSGSALRWQSPALPANVVAEVPWSNGSLLAAVAPQATWFLDAATGAVLNKGGMAVSPEGALYTTGVQPGQGRDFYFLNGSGVAGTLPVELVAVDAPENGELLRFSTNGSSLMAGVDESGQLWLRVGPNLVRPLPLIEYAEVVQR